MLQMTKNLSNYENIHPLNLIISLSVHYPAKLININF